MKYGSKKEARKWAMQALRGGIVGTIPTPWDEYGEIHEQDLRNLVRYVIDTKNDAIFICGNVGEFFSMTIAERKKVAEIVIDEVQGEIPVIVQTAHNVAKDCVDLCRHAEREGSRPGGDNFPLFSVFVGSSGDRMVASGVQPV